MKKVITLLLGISVLWACHRNLDEQLKLPYYNSALFTPEWIDSQDVAFSQIHQIKNFSFMNQNGETISSKYLEGNIYVADFFFTVCPSICPKMTSNLQRLQESFSKEEVQLVSFSVMPWVDSVQVLHNYAELHKIDSNQWNLLTGNTDSLYDLARTSFFAEKEIGLNKSSDEFLHTENFILVDGNGRIRGVYNGTLGLEIERLKTDIKTLLELG